MRDFVESMDSPDISPEDRSAALSDPAHWIEENWGITLEGRYVFWSIDLTVEPPEGAGGWLFVSPHVGELPLLKEAVVVGGPRISMIVQSTTEADPADIEDDALIAGVLELLSSHSPADWDGLRELMAGLNSFSVPEAEVAAFKDNARDFVVNSGAKFSSLNTKITVLDRVLAEDYGAIHFGPIPRGAVLLREAIAYIGETGALVVTPLI